MLGLIDRKTFGNAVRKGRVRVVPTRVQLLQRNRIRTVAVNLVRGHVDEGRIRARSARGLQQVQRADGIDIKIVERNFRGKIVRRLGGRVDDDGRLQLLDQAQDAGAVAHVE